MKSLCSGWEFTHEPSAGFLAGGECGEIIRVTLPHQVCPTPLHYADPRLYSGVYGYRRHITADDLSKRYYVIFEGAAHVAELFVNGVKAGEHFCGYTSFRTEVTGFLRPGDNVIAVRLDTTERADVPPFGGVVDYLCYGGLYREAWLEVLPQVHIEDVFVYGDERGLLKGGIETSGLCAAARCRVLDGEREVYSFECPRLEIEEGVPGVTPWSPDSPRLYTLEAAIYGENGAELDKKRVRFGFRRAEFKADGFYLNGKRCFMRGLDRHQCWPYIGYAAPESLQREDARILKEELAVNAVRTSHYPQSRHFIDACDEMGILVFTETPGWQHIGDALWKDRTVENVREMVREYRNHPSIVLWGVRINESRDDDELYRRTNAAAHELDPSRATSGVRFIKKSSLLEDVYAFNDFSHRGGNPGCLPKKDVTPDMEKALLISEHSGHMFPTKAFDNAPRRQEHALRHARVLDAAYRTGEHAGCFGWCMFDYATHRDFGSGDRICYHGVMDSFRNPKLAASVYASQGENRPVLELSSPMEIGDYNASFIGPVYVFTNCDEVDLYKNGEFVTTLRPKKAGLPHPPIEVDDIVGGLLKKNEGFTGAKERVIRECLNAAAKYGMEDLPLSAKLKFAEAMAVHHMSYEQGYALYGKYIGNWGGEVTEWRLDGRMGGEVVASITRRPTDRLKLEAIASATRLQLSDTYDMAAVRIRITDEFGAAAPYAQYPVTLELEGEAELIGPRIVTAEGGMCGAYIKTNGRSGSARLTVSCPQLDPVIIDFSINDAN